MLEKRKALSKIGLVLPAVWITPVVTSTLLPAHAQATLLLQIPGSFTGTTTVNGQGDSDIAILCTPGGRC